jgi:hypothetical protein
MYNPFIIHNLNKKDHAGERKTISFFISGSTTAEMEISPSLAKRRKIGMYEKPLTLSPT